MGPEGYGGKCEPSYNGDVTLAYSTDIGKTWFDIGTYQAVLYNTGPFFHISTTLPEQGWSNTTRFKFYQVTKPPATHACMPSQLSHLTKALPFGFATVRRALCCMALRQVAGVSAPGATGSASCCTNM